MTNTEFDPTPDMAERLSVPYVVNKETGKQEPAVRVRAAVFPAGITYGTILDQSNWLIANLNNGVFKGKRIISEATMEQMFTRQHDQFKGRIEGIWGNETTGFGLTWWSQVRDGDRYFAHSGSLSGYTAFLLGNRDRKFGFAILTNGHRAHQHLFKLGDRAIDLMKKYSAAEKNAAVSPAKMETNK
jgi:CubicO group peptidase (beta-lactamase class C family)